jgi:hypothetical protein
VVTDRGWEPGDELIVLLTNAACTYALAIRMEVVRSRQLQSGGYSLAGRFSRALEPSEIQPFLL